MQEYRTSSLVADIDLGTARPSQDRDVLTFLNKVAGYFSLHWTPFFLRKFNVRPHLNAAQRQTLDSLLLSGTVCWRQTAGSECRHYQYRPFHDEAKDRTDAPDTQKWNLRHFDSAPDGFKYMFRQRLHQKSLADDSTLPQCDAPPPNQHSEKF